MRASTAKMALCCPGGRTLGPGASQRGGGEAPDEEELSAAPRGLLDTLSLDFIPTPGLAGVARQRGSMTLPVVPKPSGEFARSLAVDGGLSEADRFGRFELIRELGRGGMGRVIEATDPDLLRSVAIKVALHPEELDEHRLARFVAEAQITGQLEHPAIVPVHDVGATESGKLYFVMKRVEGVTLSEAIASSLEGDGEFTQYRLLQAFVQTCRAVAYAHDRGVLHRDIKPSNIMLGAFGEVLVMDWGVASAVLNSLRDPLASDVFSPAGLQRLAVGLARYRGLPSGSAAAGAAT